MGGDGEPGPPMSKEELSGLLSLDDIQNAARRRLDKGLYEYLASGTADEQTLRENRTAWQGIRLKPRVMRPVRELDTSCHVLGSDRSRRARLPIFVSPAGVHSLCDGGRAGGGELSTARVAAEHGVVMSESVHATQPLEAVASACETAPGRWFQVYLLKDRAVTADLVRRALASGYTAIVLTVDSPVFGFREADARNSFNGLPEGLSLENYAPYVAASAAAASPPSSSSSSSSASSPSFTAHFDDRKESAWDQNTEKMFATDATWADVTWLKSLLRKRKSPSGSSSVQCPGSGHAGSVPLLIKGILRADDAVSAIEAGADGIIVSNHGGRQLDGCLSAIDALPAVVRAVKFYRARAIASPGSRFYHAHQKGTGTEGGGGSSSSSNGGGGDSDTIIGSINGSTISPSAPYQPGVVAAAVSSSFSSSLASSTPSMPRSLAAAAAAAPSYSPPYSPSTGSFALPAYSPDSSRSTSTSTSTSGGSVPRRLHHASPSKAQMDVERVAEEVYPVYLDGGVRRGTDVRACVRM